MLAGLQEPDSGSIRMASDTTIGYLPQDGIVHHGRTVHEEVVLAFEELLALKEEQHRIEDALAHATEDGEATTGSSSATPRSPSASSTWAATRSTPGWPTS